MEKLKKIRCFVLDMDGTIFLGNNLFPFTMDFLKAVELSGKEFYFFTNNSSKNIHTYLEKLNKMGIPTTPERMLISSDVMTRWLLVNHPGHSAYVVGTKDLEAAVEAAGITINSVDPDYVLLGFDTSLTYEKLVLACDFVRAGKPIYGLNPDLNCPTETGFVPDCGSMAALIKASTGVQCEFFGKPSPHTYRFLLEATGCREEELAIIGDRLYTDVATVSRTPSLGILVLSGETKREDIESSDTIPDLVFNDLSEITPLLSCSI